MHNPKERFSLFCSPQCKISALLSDIEKIR